MPPVEFEPAISAGERPQTHALARAGNGTKSCPNISRPLSLSLSQLITRTASPWKPG